jgi:hypothetical protein
MNDSGLSLLDFRFHLEPKAPLCMPAYNKGAGKGDRLVFREKQ